MMTFIHINYPMIFYYTNMKMIYFNTYSYVRVYINTSFSYFSYFFQLHKKA